MCVAFCLGPAPCVGPAGKPEVPCKEGWLRGV